MRVLVTGATGFVGKVLCQTLKDAGFDVIATARNPQANCITIANINEQTDWSAALAHVDVVIYLAARVHVMNETASDPLAAFQQVNSLGAINLAQQAINSGVHRFIYLSTIKVNGEQSAAAFRAEDEAQPQDPYALSKWQAEHALNQLNPLETVIIRPPLVYGKNVKGNFLRLINLVRKGRPIPLGSVNNQRSLVNVDNLCDLIKTCINHPQAKNQTFLVSDNDDISTAQLIHLMAEALQQPARLIKIPVNLLNLAGKLLGKSAEIERLCGDLRIDMQHTMTTLDWQPPYSVKQGIEKAVQS